MQTDHDSRGTFPHSPSPNRALAVGRSVADKGKLIAVSQRCLAVLLPIAFLMLSGCGKNQETEKLKKELEQLKTESERQSLEKNVAAIKECTLQGSVFIVTKGGTNFKLGLIPIVIADPEQMRKHLDDKFSAFTTLAQAHRDKFETNVAALAAANKAAELNLERLSQASAACTNAQKMLEVCAIVYNGFDKVSVRQNGDSKVYQTRGAELLVALGVYNEAKRPLKPYFEKANAAYMATLTERSQILYLLNTHLEEVFRDLPRSELLKTNADGEFHINLPRRKTVIVAGRGQRSVGKDIEKYFWMTEVTLPDKDTYSIFLSNDNLVTEIPGHSDRLYGYLPPEPKKPAYNIEDFNRQNEVWTFDPPLTNAKAAEFPKVPGAKTTRNGNTLILGSGMSADVLDEKGDAVGLRTLASGTQITILKEDATHVYFENGSKPLRLEKAKIEPSK